MTAHSPATSSPQSDDKALEFDVHITEALLRRVGLRGMFRKWRLNLVAVMLILIGSYPDIAAGRLGTISAVCLTIVALKVLLYAAYYIRMRRSIADWKRLQGDDPVHYRLTDETLRARSNLGNTELRWNVFRELLEHPDFLLLRMGRSGHLTLSRSDVPPEALAFIRERFASNGLPTKHA